MAIITLTTDFGEKDHYTGAAKGAIYSELPDVNIVDISHVISPFNTLEAAYIIKNAYHSFPKGTIHIIDVDSELSPENKHIAIKLDDHFFICANNGIMSMICAEIVPDNIIEIRIPVNLTKIQPIADAFVKAACHIARGGTLEVIGKRIESIKPIKNLKPFVNENQTQIVGHVLYIDNYGNVITNVKRSFFDNLCKGRTFEIVARNHKFNTINDRYCDIVNFELEANKRHDEGRKLVVFNSSGFLEIALYKSNPEMAGSASSLLGLKVMDSVLINFKPFNHEQKALV